MMYSTAQVGCPVHTTRVTSKPCDDSVKRSLAGVLEGGQGCGREAGVWKGGQGCGRAGRGVEWRAVTTNEQLAEVY